MFINIVEIDVHIEFLNLGRLARRLGGFGGFVRTLPQRAKGPLRGSLPRMTGTHAYDRLSEY